MLPFVSVCVVHMSDIFLHKSWTWQELQDFALTKWRVLIWGMISPSEYEPDTHTHTRTSVLWDFSFQVFFALHLGRSIYSDLFSFFYYKLCFKTTGVIITVTWPLWSYRLFQLSFLFFVQSLKATRNFSVSDWSKNFEVVFQDEEGKRTINTRPIGEMTFCLKHFT